MLNIFIIFISSLKSQLKYIDYGTPVYVFYICVLEKKNSSKSYDGGSSGKAFEFLNISITRMSRETRKYNQKPMDNIYNKPRWEPAPPSSKTSI